MGVAENLRSAFIDALDRRRATDPGLAVFIDGLSATRCLEQNDASIAAHAAGHLSDALNGLACDAELANAVRSFSARAAWYQLLEGTELDPVLVAGMLVGRPELAPGAPVLWGLFLIAPDVHYPLDQHAAEEVYFVGSGSLSIQHGRSGAPFALGPGEYSVTPHNGLHALQTHEDPCLIFYCWAGNIDAPNWWWAADEAGWHRTRWDRTPEGPWFRVATEPVTPAILADAGEN